MRIGNRSQALEWCSFQSPWTTVNPDFKVTPLFNAEYLRNGVPDIDSYNEILIGACALLKSVVSNDLEWHSEIFNDVKHRAASLRQLSLLFPGYQPPLLRYLASVKAKCLDMVDIPYLCEFDRNDCLTFYRQPATFDEAVIKYPTGPQTCRYTTLWNITVSSDAMNNKCLYSVAKTTQCLKNNQTAMINMT